MYKLAFTISLLILVLSCSKEEPKEELSYPLQIADHYGVNSFGDVESLEFSFNVERGENTFRRSWEFYPEEERIVSISSDNNIIEFTRSADLDSLQIEADRGFVNDTFWLLFPHQLKWGEGTYEYDVQEGISAPLSGEKVTKLTIQYNNEVGYTPGDAYDLFIKDDKTIIEWIFRNGGQEEPNYTMTWEGQKDVNGQKIPTLFATKDRDFKIKLADIEVNLRKD